jgi:DNA-binding transcriptional regulator WhiA
MVNSQAYSYILGLYLGDGYINKQSRTYKLRLILGLKHPLVIEDSKTALKKLFPNNKVSEVSKKGFCIEVVVHSNSIPDLFPQHDKGKKHERKILLQNWQLNILDWKLFMKGLIHSDGSFFIAKQGEYHYERFEFTNKSLDIINLFEEGCNVLGLKYSTRYNQKNDIYRVSVNDVDTLKSFANKC